ncbi:hypothetical protein V6N13_116002 [Hibiscus sabdariffa]
MHRVGLVEKMGLEDITADEWVDGLDEEFGSQMDPTFEGTLKSKPEKIDVRGLWRDDDFGFSFSKAMGKLGERQLHNVLQEASQGKGSVEEMKFRTLLQCEG